MLVTNKKTVPTATQESLLNGDVAPVANETCATAAVSAGPSSTAAYLLAPALNNHPTPVAPLLAPQMHQHPHDIPRMADKPHPMASSRPSLPVKHPIQWSARRGLLRTPRVTLQTCPAPRAFQTELTRASSLGFRPDCHCLHFSPHHHAQGQRVCFFLPQNSFGSVRPLVRYPLVDLSLFTPRMFHICFSLNSPFGSGGYVMNFSGTMARLSHLI